ncbi:MAG: zinc ribbon domain-containing protein [Nitrospinales bacterium]
MPLYEYFCDTCQKDFTLLQSANVKKEETVCPDCGSQKVQTKFSSFAPKVKASRQPFSKPVTADELPNKNVLNLPVPRLRSEL